MKQIIGTETKPFLYVYILHGGNAITQAAD